MSRQTMDEIEPMTAGAAASSDTFFRLGVMYAAGRSVPVDRVLAHAYLSVAAARGRPEAAQYRKELAVEMTRSEITEAQRRAREWMTLH